jgi:hypothetical protein
MPSDVFGGYLIAALWSAIAVAALCSLEERRPSGILDLAHMRPSRSTSTPSAERLLRGAPLVAAPIAIALAVVLRTDHPEVFAIDHLSLVIAASGIAALASLIASTFTLALRR